MNKNYIRFFRFENLFKLGEYTARYIKKSLTGLHYGQIIIRDNAENIQNLTEHFFMLPSHYNQRLKVTGMRF